MTKRITITLTEEQANWVLNQLMYYDDEPMNHPENQFIKRIITKFEQLLGKA